MDHNYAIENHTAERYLLQELNEEERDAYEEHFFSCSVCAEEVKTASEFLETAKHVVQDEIKSQLHGHAVHHSLWGSWLNFRSLLHPLPAMACALFVVMSGFGIYQNWVTIPELRQIASAAQPTPGMTIAQVLNAKSTIIAEEARDEQKTQIVKKSEPFQLQFDVRPDNSGSYQSYVAYVETAGGIRKLSYNILKAETKSPVKVAVAAGALESGNYFVVVRGVNSNGTESRVKGEPDRLSFQLNVQD
jgi:hypothetical protein